MSSFAAVLAILSLIICSVSARGAQYARVAAIHAPACSNRHFWSADFRKCLRCKPCVAVLVPCSPTADAVCDDSATQVLDEGPDPYALFNHRRPTSATKEEGKGEDEAAEDGTSSDFANRPSDKNQRRTATHRVRESIRNSAQSKIELLAALTDQFGVDAKPTVADEVDGSVRLEAPDSANLGRTLHDDLRAIERALLLEDGEIEPTEVAPQAAASEFAVGKKRLYSSLEEDYADATTITPPTEVYGAVRQDPDSIAVSVPAPTERPLADEFGLIHTMLHASSPAPQNGDANGGSNKGLER